jgi:peptidoglycan/xylan/chitin deacetylase (PgdA/CDA1 family)
MRVYARQILHNTAYSCVPLLERWMMKRYELCVLLLYLLVGISLGACATNTVTKNADHAVQQHLNPAVAVEPAVVVLPATRVYALPVGIPIPEVATGMHTPTHHTCRPLASFKPLALTFDDGPHPIYTPQILDVLARHHVHATFFLVGSNVVRYPGVVARMYREGHQIGNHTWSHPDLTRLSASAIRDQIERTNEAIEAIIGVRPTTIRPPYGAIDARVRHLLDQHIVLWTVDPNDWRDRVTKTVIFRVVHKAQVLSDILLHDIHPTTAAAVDTIVSSLLDEGYTFVTIDELAGLGKTKQFSACT